MDDYLNHVAGILAPFQERCDSDDVRQRIRRSVHPSSKQSEYGDVGSFEGGVSAIARLSKHVQET